MTGRVEQIGDCTDDRVTMLELQVALLTKMMDEHLAAHARGRQPKRRVGFWTPERDDVLRRMRAEGKQARKIAAAVGCKVGMVHDRAHALGLTAIPNIGNPETNWSEAERQMLRDMVAEGVRSFDAAMRLNRTLEAVRAQMRKMNLRSQVRAKMHAAKRAARAARPAVAEAPVSMVSRVRGEENEKDAHN